MLSTGEEKTISDRWDESGCVLLIGFFGFVTEYSNSTSSGTLIVNVSSSVQNLCKTAVEGPNDGPGWWALLTLDPPPFITGANLTFRDWNWVRVNHSEWQYGLAQCMPRLSNRPILPFKRWGGLIHWLMLGFSACVTWCIARPKQTSTK